MGNDLPITTIHHSMVHGECLTYGDHTPQPGALEMTHLHYPYTTAQCMENATSKHPYTTSWYRRSDSLTTSIDTVMTAVVYRNHPEMSHHNG